jgi:hypothetical protein
MTTPPADRDPRKDPRPGDSFRVYDATVSVKTAGHGTVVLTRGGKYEVQMSMLEFEKWVEMKNAEVIKRA